METYFIAEYMPHLGLSAPDEFEEAIHDAMLQYSLLHLLRAGGTSQEEMMEAMQKAMQICMLAGINIKHHFKQIFVSDLSTGETYPDWRMSKKAFKLTIMQYPSLNEEIARWLWEMAEV